MNKKIEVIQPSGILDGISGNELRQQAIELVDNGTNIILVDCFSFQQGNVNIKQIRNE